jgi:hypothetical protein
MREKLTFGDLREHGDQLFLDQLEPPDGPSELLLVFAVLERAAW